MKLQAIKRFPRMACLVLAAVLAPWYAGAVVATTAGSDLPASPSSPLPPAPPTVGAPMAPPAAKLSPSAREVLKLVTAGVPEDVVKAYIQSSSSMFNLSSDNIVEMHDQGVSGMITAEMITHDTAYRNNAAAMAAGPPQQPQSQTQTPVYPQATDQYAYSTATPTPDYTQQYYNDLAPYGNWSYVPGYGYGWQAYPSLNYAYYPWGVLGFGLWNWCPGVGWCWFPREHFRDFDRFHGGFRDRDGDRFRGFNHGEDRFRTFNHGFNNNNFGHPGGFQQHGGQAFVGNQFGGFHNSGFASHQPIGGGTFHNFGGGSFGHSGGVSHFSGGGGTHFSGGGGGHFSGSGGGHSGGFGGGHH